MVRTDEALMLEETGPGGTAGGGDAVVDGPVREVLVRTAGPFCDFEGVEGGEEGFELANCWTET